MKLGVCRSQYRAILVNITFVQDRVAHHDCRITVTVFSLGGGRGDGDCRRQGWPHRECRAAGPALSRQHFSVKKQQARRWLGGGGGGSGGVREGWRLLDMFMIFSQNKVSQRFVEQIIDDMVGLDRVQQRFVEQDLETPRVGLHRSGVGLVAP